jgi:hypothetical protein
MLAAFLLAQSWLICLPMCALEGHGAMMPGGSGHHMHSVYTALCHPGVTVLHEHPVAITLGAMLAPPLAPALPPPALRQLTLAPAAPFHLQQIPPADPPPPRSA